MTANSFGHHLRLESFGESHGPAIGGVLHGMPAGFPVSEDAIQQELDRRRPGQSELTSPRNEKDRVHIYSGIFEGKTLGTPIGFLIFNEDRKSEDYEHLKSIYRPSHADYTWEAKFGFRDHRGGGRSSARETAVRVVAGAFAKQLIATLGVKIHAYVSALGPLETNIHPGTFNPEEIEKNPVRCPDPIVAAEMEAYIKKLKESGDSAGGIITCRAENVPAGLGEPVFHKLQADLGAAILSINTCKAFEYGMGFEGCRKTGSEMNDEFTSKNGKISTLTNHSGGIQGGISNGEPIYFKAGFKPIATIGKTQNSVSTEGIETTLQAKGRHDPTVLPRAVPIVEAMTALVLADHAILQGLIPRKFDATA